MDVEKSRSSLILDNEKTFDNRNKLQENPTGDFPADTSRGSLIIDGPQKQTYSIILSSRSVKSGPTV